MIDYNDNQRSLDWFRMRLGNITGSRCGDLMKSGRKKDETFGETAKSYIMQLAAERMMNPAVVEDDELFGEYVDCVQVTSKAMRFGTEQEGVARDLFADMAKVRVVEPSSCKHDTIPHFAASPDGIVLDWREEPLACVEIKCPKIDTYVKYLDIHGGESLKAINPLYYWQTQAEMCCTGTDTCYFVVYSPWLVHPLHVAVIERNDDDVEALTERITLANELIEETTHGDRTFIQGIFADLHKRATDRTV